ncbi:serine/threonine protein phosphatase Pzh1 [Tritrichomonas musculus]|uniref:protein-serine/threonine phosphatase n=1 Tax=Tritrichomonas musculus TaxID=1915356 RepID=A0ABR2GUT9_9EUKA
MFLGTYHNKLHGQSIYETLAVEQTYNLFSLHKKINSEVTLPIREENLIQICDLAKSCLLEDPTVLRIKPRIHIIGDVRGNYNQIWRMVSTNEPTDQFLFLGDYISKGKNSIELFTLILCMKLLAPKQIFLLRGSQETSKKAKSCGFEDECNKRFSSEVYKKFLEVFECFPLAAIATNDEKTKSILFMNGGISPSFLNIYQLDTIQRPIKDIEGGIVHEILFADPSSNINHFGSKKNSDNAYIFGSEAAHDFLKRNNFDQLIRSHKKGNRTYPFGNDHSVISIYSAGGLNLLVREDMLCTFSRINDYTFEKNNIYNF